MPTLSSEWDTEVYRANPSISVESVPPFAGLRRKQSFPVTAIADFGTTQAQGGALNYPTPLAR